MSDQSKSLNLDRELKNKVQAVKPNFDLGSEDGLPLPRVVAVFVLVIGLGLISGYLLARRRSGELAGGEVVFQAAIPETGVTSGQVFGSPDEETFKDKAGGLLEKNEAEEQEGTHRLIRDPDNPSQNANLISSVVDLDKLVGREVEVWGETFYSEKVGWLMDVGRVKVKK